MGRGHSLMCSGARLCVGPPFAPLHFSCQPETGKEKSRSGFPERLPTLPDVCVSAEAAQLVSHVGEERRQAHHLGRGSHLLGVDDTLDRDLLPGGQLGHLDRHVVRHAGHEADERARRGTLLLTARSHHDDLAAQLAAGLRPCALVLRTEVAGRVVADVGVNRLDEIVAHLSAVGEELAVLVLATASGLGRFEEALGIEAVAIGEGHAKDLGLVVNGCGLLPAGLLGLDGLAVLG